MKYAWNSLVAVEESGCSHTFDGACQVRSLQLFKKSVQGRGKPPREINGRMRVTWHLLNFCLLALSAFHFQYVG